MRKLIALLAGVALFFAAVFGSSVYLDRQIVKNQAHMRVSKTYSRYWSHDANALLLDEKTLLLFGSSELNSPEAMTDGWEARRGDYLNGKNIRVMTIGGGNFQSLSHAITLGSLSDDIQSGKVALLLSPQWFTAEDGMEPDAFAARFSEDQLLHFLDNDKVSMESKTYVLDRTIQLLQNSPTQQKRVIKYKQALENSLSLATPYKMVMKAFWSYRTKWEAYEEGRDYEEPLAHEDPAETDFNALLTQAEEAGRQACSNNDFGIHNEYWETYSRSVYEQGENPQKVQAAVKSVEYDDLRCFLQIARETGIEVMLVNTPVNAKWYTYTGQLFGTYYDNIRSIAGEYDNVRLIDMSQYENEPYFLKDIMHLGWKGWVRTNEALYKEFVGE